MTKLMAFQEAVKTVILPERHVLLMSPSGFGMDRVIVSSFESMPGSKLIIDSKLLEVQWKRLLNEFDVEATVVSPEKLRSDIGAGVEYSYDIVVWNLSTAGPKTLEAVKTVANKASVVWLRRIEWLGRKRDMLKGFVGDFKIVNIGFDSQHDMYPVLIDDPEYSAKMLRFLGK